MLFELITHAEVALAAAEEAAEAAEPATEVAAEAAEPATEVATETAEPALEVATEATLPPTLVRLLKSDTAARYVSDVGLSASECVLTLGCDGGEVGNGYRCDRG